MWLLWILLKDQPLFISFVVLQRQDIQDRQQQVPSWRSCGLWLAHSPEPSSHQSGTLTGREGPVSVQGLNSNSKATALQPSFCVFVFHKANTLWFEFSIPFLMPIKSTWKLRLQGHMNHQPTNETAQAESCQCLFVFPFRVPKMCDFTCNWFYKQRSKAETEKTVSECGLPWLGSRPQPLPSSSSDSELFMGSLNPLPCARYSSSSDWSSSTWSCKICSLKTNAQSTSNNRKKNQISN